MFHRILLYYLMSWLLSSAFLLPQSEANSITPQEEKNSTSSFLSPEFNLRPFPFLLANSSSLSLFLFSLLSFPFPIRVKNQKRSSEKIKEKIKVKLKGENKGGTWNKPPKKIFPRVQFSLWTSNSSRPLLSAFFCVFLRLIAISTFFEYQVRRRIWMK